MWQLYEIQDYILYQAQSENCQNTTTVAAYQLIDRMLISNRLSSKFNFQWAIKLVTELKGPTDYTRGQNICIDAPRLQIAVHALLQAQHLCLALCSLLWFGNSCNQTGTGQTAVTFTSCWFPKDSLKLHRFDVESRPLQKWELKVGAFIPSTMCMVRGAGGGVEKEKWADFAP